MRLLLIVSPDDALSDALRQCTRRLGHSALAAPDTRRAQRMLTRFTPNLLCVDTVCPSLDLERFWRWLAVDPARRALPILFVAPRLASLVPSMLPSAFRPERDGQICRPLDSEEFTRELNRLLAAVSAPERVEVLQVGRLTLNLSSYELTVPEGGGVVLTQTEFKLVRYLMERPGTFVPPEEIVERVWGYRPDPGGLAVVRAHVANVRRKLRSGGLEAGLLRTVPYRGYAFAASQERSTG